MNSGPPTLFPYQRVGAEWLAGRRAGFLADEPGLGKSAQAIAAARMVGAGSAAVICPAVACGHWAREWRMWWPEGPLPVVASYDKLVARKPLRMALRDMCPDVLILDEAHYLKNRNAKRTRAVYGRLGAWGVAGSLVERAGRVWALSGTPAPNHPIEWFTHLTALWPEHMKFFQRYWQFLEYFAVRDQFDHPRGVRHADEMRKLLGKVALRRRVEEVLPDLPELHWGVVPVSSASAREQLRAMEADPIAQALRERVERGRAPFRSDETAIATLREFTGRLKAPLVADELADELEEPGAAMVVFAQHLRVLDILQEKLSRYGVVRIDGSVAGPERVRRIDAFQRPDGPKVFLGQLQACGTAITLTRAHQVVFVEQSWVPDENIQAAKRCHRIGQRDAVIARAFVLDGSLDDLVGRIIAAKIKNRIEIGENDDEDDGEV